MFLWSTLTVNAAVDAPDIRCVSVQNNGNITVFWLPPADLNNEFVEYNLYFSNALGGPYTSISINGLATSQYLHGVNGNGNSFYYYLETVYNDGMGNQSSAPSDTAQSILPQFGPVSDSTAIVNWNPVFQPNLGSNDPNYTVERMFGVSGVWVNVATPVYGNETFADAFKFCSDSVYYRVSIGDQSGCISTSAILKDLFEDNTPPATPVLDSVTVLPNGNARVDWKPSSSLDTKGYYVYYYFKPTATYVSRATILGRLNTGYEELDPLIDTQAEYHDFTVVAYDSCTVPRINISPGAPDQRTIHLSLVPNNCEQSVDLKWNSYINWDNLAGYQVLAATFGQPFDTVYSGGVQDTTFTFFRPDGLNVYCFKVQAITNDGTKTSTSNVACSNASNAVVPAKQYFRKISVQNNNEMKVVTLSDTSLELSSYRLFRSLSPGFGFIPVAEVPFSTDEVISFTDSSALVTQTPYFYRVGLIDSCGVTVFRSPPSPSMHLTGHLSDDSLNVQLQWNFYSSWDSVGSGVRHYRIVSVNDGKKTIIDSVSSAQNWYDYQLEDDITLGANLCFEIEAIEDSGNVYGFADTALSNQVCFYKNTKIYVPSAFRPTGINNVFRPVIAYGNVSEYEMIIYNRWGQNVFETSSVDLGWDGLVNGQMAQLGAYVYIIRIKNFSGSVKVQSGTFILLN